MTGICKTLDCFYGAQQITDCPSDGYRAIKVYRDGNPIEIAGPFDTQDEAEEWAEIERQSDLRDNGQFGVGA